MNPVQVQPVIMAGGSGTRLWPLSRAGFPKQFLVLSGNTSLFQQAAARLQGLAGEGLAVAAPLVVCNEEHRFLVLDQLRESRSDPAAVLLEPVGRNTAPAVTLAALQAVEARADPVLVVTPADQTVTEATAFNAALARAVRAANEGAIVILGVTPDRPETGYGYIRADGPRVAQFVEKPDLATAEQYLARGGYFWNAGMFVLKASAWLEALQRFRPDMLAACRAAWAARKTDALFVRPGAAEFAAVPGDSVDYAVMEKCPGVLDIRMEPLAAGWNDLGAWEAVWQVAEKDAQGNAAVGDAIVSDSHNTLVHATSRLVSVVGLDDVVVVETPDAVLVASREKSQDVKNIVAQLGREQRGEQVLHRKVHRPWGWYDGIDQGPRHQVKRILVKPGASLSLQMHHHRAEHWIVVTGTAEVTVGDKVLLLAENQSTYIPLGARHRLRNPGKVPLEIIEVQSGSYLGEDDIVRFEDTYGRS
ncbi:MAG TPA: mannose-1-phosphate guanylyltransferase/mannose-6-phosphate isomerase [Rubrivivax sp.]|nr:mannose-1-phosphate guanylyltransferase/mannose-6-phosphate isomerase [Betaproteobacteria bacterium]MBL0297893.1 mannose-1-phosphate guanylyltransferase/mannose-6-phosphate isomerase [Betaproteobacteria bacterium]MBP6317909.1 mannose-1-phosphate guanylyltransferase/mannose-6-phosphate isomerase [Rubrivivax sp.]MBP6465385.1 mannose-1-phosphate guanylyltransferase/mannose-6-phosphate isomerase [Rubrivivax sp.]HRC36732.1 mannose-1-phosphate guanylyltransferase/mannose-6-phosphate isomerase [Rub